MYGDYRKSAKRGEKQHAAGMPIYSVYGGLSVDQKHQASAFQWLEKLLNGVPKGKLMRLSWILPFELTAENVRGILRRHSLVEIKTPRIFCDHRMLSLREPATLELTDPRSCLCSTLQTGLAWEDMLVTELLGEVGRYQKETVFSLMKE